ncbi:MAG: NIPSNAP family protein, partial [Rickettsiales bacterium]
MLYEMRTYSFLPTDLPKYLKHAEEVGRPVRGNDYGVNCGYWTSEFGRLNQVWHLWQYESYAQREELR